MNSKTRAFFCETVSNPALDVSDLEEISSLAHKNGVPLIVDDTFTTAHLMKPIDFGADIICTSLTKWTGGHGTAIGGCIIDAGRFDWDNGKHPIFVEPDKSYHGLRWYHDLPEPLKPMAYILRLRTVLVRNTGACVSPDNSWMFLQGIETLPLRMEKHCSNALAVAQFLKKHPGAAWVRYPGLSDDKMYELNQRYLKGKGGGMVVFGVQGGKAAGGKFIDALRLVSHVANVGDAKSLAINPATTTHSQLSDEQLREAGVPAEMIRLSIGIEDADDIISDISQALEAATGTASSTSPSRWQWMGHRDNRRIPLFPKVMNIGDRVFQYNVYGPVLPGGHQGPPIVAVCGWGMVKEEWGKLAHELSGISDVLTFDNQGIGGSLDAAEDAFTLDSWANDVLALVDKEYSPETRFAVLGYSLGAFLAQHLAISRPDRIHSIICISAQGPRKTSVAGKSSFFKLSNKTMATGKNTIKDNIERMTYHFSPEEIKAQGEEHWAALTKQNLNMKRPEATVKKQFKILVSADLPLEKVRCPVLALSGEQDVIIPVANGKLFMEALTNAPRKSLVVLQGQGHQCWGICPPRRQLNFNSRDTPTATHAVVQSISHFFSEILTQPASKL
mmetsp:Transcript_26527/g.48823  ORF Transcript_26527/g.48823 Transcript_26527/m.48823 type:complete len:616 (+) Transcript_26527:1-1848(+)